MNVFQYALPIAAMLLLVVFYLGLPALKSCGLPGESLEKDRRQLTRADLIIIAAVTLVYAAIAFYDLGDKAAPQNFVHMGSEIIDIELSGDAPPSSIMLYTGVSTGSYDIAYSNDGVAYQTVYSFEQSYGTVLKWHSLTPETELRASYVRITSTGGTPFIGEIAFLDGDGTVIPARSETPGIVDEQTLIPSSINYHNSTYFDEIYHARTAWEHLNGVWPYEISHPPLGKIIISIGVTLFGMNPFGWRFMGTLFGVLMLPLMYLLLKKIFGGKWVPALGTVLFASDFMHFAQTRIATIDTYAVFFILLMYLFMYDFYQEGKLKSLALSGLFFGIGAASKWTCIYAGLGLAVLWAMYWLRNAKALGFRAFLRNVLFCVGFFIVIPCLIYYCSYYPYATSEDVRPIFSSGYLKIVLDNQKYMFNYHAGVVAEHPYSSRWYQWILNIRPILYYLEYFDDGMRSSIASFLNPFLCWGGLLSLFALGYTAIFRRDRKAAFILSGYLSQLLPWVFISRLTFEYHYFPSSVFLVLSLCYVFDLMRRNSKEWKVYALGFVGVSVVLFVMFYPVLSGMPVNNYTAHSWLGWLPTWPI